MMSLCIILRHCLCSFMYMHMKKYFSIFQRLNCQVMTKVWKYFLGTLPSIAKIQHIHKLLDLVCDNNIVVKPIKNSSNNMSSVTINNSMRSSNGLLLYYMPSRLQKGKGVAHNTTVLYCIKNKKGSIIHLADSFLLIARERMDC